MSTACSYGFRRAEAGSIRTARHAGPAIDIAAVIPTTIVTNAKVAGSSGRTPNSIVSMRRPKTADSTSPIAAPVAIDARRVHHHEAKDVVRRGPERPADAEIAHVLLDRIREDAEHADHGQDERQRRKGDDQHGAEAMTPGRRPGDVFERPDVAHADQLFLVDAGDGRAHRAGVSASARPDCGRTTRKMSSDRSCAIGT